MLEREFENENKNEAKKHIKCKQMSARMSLLNQFRSSCDTLHVDSRIQT